MAPTEALHGQLDCHGPSQTADSGPPSTEHGACGEDSGLGSMPRASDGVERTLHDTYRGNQTLLVDVEAREDREGNLELEMECVSSRLPA